jgi:hypothetical protein
MSILSDVMLAPEVVDPTSGYIESLIDQAKGIILEYTRLGESLADWPEDDAVLDGACTRLALHLYRKAGTENAETARVGDLSVTNYDMPPDVKVVLNGRRRAGWL